MSGLHDYSVKALDVISAKCPIVYSPHSPPQVLHPRISTRSEDLGSSRQGLHISAWRQFIHPCLSIVEVWQSRSSNGRGVAYKHMLMASVLSVMLGAREGAAPAGVNANYRRTTGLQVGSLGHTQSPSHNNAIHSRISTHRALPSCRLSADRTIGDKVPKVKLFGLIIYCWCIVFVCMVHVRF